MHLITQLLLFIKTYESWGYVIVFLMALAETIPLVGIIVPGATIIGLLGVLAAQGYFHPGLLIIAASLGAIVGDAFGYWLGTKGTRFFKNGNKFLKASHLEKGKEFFGMHGSKSVLLGRFIGPLRAIVPFVAGLSRMNAKSFLFWNVIGGILWSFAFVLLGYFFGSAFISIEHWWIRISMLIVAVLAVGGVVAFTAQWRKDSN